MYICVYFQKKRHECTQSFADFTHPYKIHTLLFIHKNRLFTFYLRLVFIFDIIIFRSTWHFQSSRLRFSSGGVRSPPKPKKKKWGCKHPQTNTFLFLGYQNITVFSITYQFCCWCLSKMWGCLTPLKQFQSGGVFSHGPLKTTHLGAISLWCTT